MTGADIRMSRNVLFIKPAKRHPYKGKWLTALELSELTGIPRPTIYARLRRGQPFDQTGTSGHVPQRYLFRDQMMTVAEVVTLTGLDRSTVYDRISGKRIMEAHEIEPAFQLLEDWGDRIRIITYRGKSNSIAGWAREAGMQYATLCSRLRTGWTMEQALTRPVDHRRASKTVARNRRIITQMTIGFRRIRNHQIINRISSSFEANTGGYSQTSKISQRTGVDRLLRDSLDFGGGKTARNTA